MWNLFGLIGWVCHQLVGVCVFVCELEGCVWEAKGGEEQCRKDQTCYEESSVPVLKESCSTGMALIELIFVLCGACVVFFWLKRAIMMLAPKASGPIPGSFFTSMGKWAGEVFFTQLNQSIFFIFLSVCFLSFESGCQVPSFLALKKIV